MPQAFGQRTLSPAEAQTANRRPLSYSNNSSSLSMTTLAAPRSLSCGRAWSAFLAFVERRLSSAPLARLRR
jgi:hypothetical protein